MSYYRNPPRSVASVESALSQGGWLDLSGLILDTGLSPRTIRYALKKLKIAGLLSEKLNFRDMRKINYGLKPLVTQ